MPLKFAPIRGRPSQVFLKYIGTDTVAPTPVTVTVAAPGAAAGANVVPVSALSADIPKNTILVFDRAAGTPDEMKVVVTMDVATGATSLPVEDYEGNDGDGIPFNLQSGDAAVWDGLHTDIASQNLDFQMNPQTQDLSAVTHGSATGVSVVQPEITGVSPQIPRTGLFFEEGPLIKDILRYGDTGGNWWAKYVIAGSDGLPFAVREGLAIVMNVGTPTPADNLVQLSYTVRFKAMPVVDFPGESGS